MKKIIVAIALMLGVIGANAQNAEQPETEVVTFQADTYPQEMSGDNYNGLTKKLTFDRMIPPYGLEVTYDKTVHVIFPSAVRYVDLGSPNLIAGKADGAENVIRIKATVKNFRSETNLSVITEKLVSVRKFLTVAFTRITFSAPSALPAIRLGEPKST